MYKDPRLDIEISPPLDGTLDLQLEVAMESEYSDLMGAERIIRGLVTLPAGLKFRTLRLLVCGDDNPQLLIDACAPTLESVEFTGEGFSASFLLIRDCPRFTGSTCQASHLIFRSVSHDTPRSES